MPVGLAIGSGIGGIASAFGSRSASKDMARALKAQAAAIREQTKFNKERMAWFQGEYQSYREKFAPLEDAMLQEAMQGREGDYAGIRERAVADTQAAFESAQDQEARRMERLGLDPTSGRYQEAQNRLGLTKAAQQAGMINTQTNVERRRAEDITDRLRSQSLGLGSQRQQMMLSGMQGAASGVNKSYSNLSSMYGGAASTYGGQASQLGAAAGEMIGTGIGLYASTL